MHFNAAFSLRKQQFYCSALFLNHIIILHVECLDVWLYMERTLNEVQTNINIGTMYYIQHFDRTFVKINYNYYHYTII